MSALPLPESPADDVVDVLDLVQLARINRRRSQEHLTLLTADAAPVLEQLPAARLYYDVDRVVATYRVALWDMVVAELEASARRMGLQP